MPFPNEGTLVTDKREIAISDKWETQAEWAAYQSKNRVVISNGIVKLEEITIPDIGDLHHHYDITQEGFADGDTITAVTDQTGNGYDLTAEGDPLAQANEIGGNTVARMDGTGDALYAAFSALSQPHHIFVVFRMRSLPSQFNLVYDSETTDAHSLAAEENNNGYNINAGNGATVGTSDTNAHLVNILFDGSNSHVRIDGTDIFSGNVGTNPLNGIALGRDRTGGGYSPVDIGEEATYPQDKTTSESEIEQYFIDKWGPF